MNETQRFVILTGGPGAGKTTVVNACGSRGIAISPEAGRAVIREQRESGGSALPWADRAAFAMLMAERDIAAFEAAKHRGGTVIFDRGLPDVIGYLRLCGLAVPPELDAAARRLRYHADVFVAPPWREIYETDAERRQDFAEACRTCEAMIAVYRDYGYATRLLPQASVAERAEFILGHIGER